MFCWMFKFFIYDSRNHMRGDVVWVYNILYSISVTQKICDVFTTILAPETSNFQIFHYYKITKKKNKKAIHARANSSNTITIYSLANTSNSISIPLLVMHIILSYRVLHSEVNNYFGIFLVCTTQYVYLNKYLMLSF